MNKKNCIFFGTSYVALDSLKIILKSDILKVNLIVSKHEKTPVAGFAKEQNIDVLFPGKFSDEILNDISNKNPDIFAVVDYGKIMPQKLLDIPKYGAFNLHFSLLPFYRGASPVQSAILNGEKTSGVTVFKLTKELDEGDIYAQKEIKIAEKRADQVFKNMIEKGSEILKKVLEEVSTKKYQKKALPQDHSKASFCGKFTKESGKIDLAEENVENFLRKMRAFYPWPSVYFAHPDLGLIKILDAKIADESEIENKKSQNKTGLFAHNKKLYLALSDGVLEVKEIQREAKKSMSGEEFLRGVEV